MARRCTKFKSNIPSLLQITLALICISSTLATQVHSSSSSTTTQSPSHGNVQGEEEDLDLELKNYMDSVFNVDRIEIVSGVSIERVNENVTTTLVNATDQLSQQSRSLSSVEEYFGNKLDEFIKSHSLSVDVKETARLWLPTAEGAGKSSFLAGFGMGFLAFALKKLLIPVVLGAQLMKSVVIAMFLPTILGGLGKIVGKGLSTFSGISGASSTGLNGHQAQPMEEFEFKDTDPYSATNDATMVAGDEYSNNHQVFAADANQLDVVDSSTTSSNSRFGMANHRISAAYENSIIQQHNDNYYVRRPNKKTDFKVFHQIPSSSMLLTSYDPFYSPLLSRLDAIFQQLGLAGGDAKKSTDTENCRERLICLMYANPAKYAPYSNLVSAQLSRELNELRKPSSDNPDILRFFRYMKAAKDGQDGVECQNHNGCPSMNKLNPSPAILTTFNDINKLVLARKFN